MEEKIEFKVQVKLPLGIHTRPATVIVKALQGTKCSVAFTYKNQTVNAKSILGILMLAVTRNSKLKVTIEGEGAAEAKEKLIAILENQNP